MPNLSDFLSPKDARTGGAFYSGVHPGREAQYAPKPKPQATPVPQIPLATFMKVALPFMRDASFYNPGPQQMASKASVKAPMASRAFQPKTYGVGPLGVALNTPKFQKAKSAYLASLGGADCSGGT